MYIRMCAASCSVAGHVKIIIFVVFLNFVHKLLPTARNDIREEMTTIEKKIFF